MDQLPPTIESLEYAPVQRTPSIRPVIRLLILVVGGPMATFIAISGLERGAYGYSCAKCGAEAAVKELRWYGLGGRYGWRIVEGPVAKFLQNGKPCAHAWDLAGGGSRGWFVVSCCRGNYSRKFLVSLIEACPDPTTAMANELKKDPMFREKLAKVVQKPNADGSLELVDAFVRQIP